MRPDEHKSKESRKYQARKKLAGDSSAVEIANARKKAAKARDKGEGMTAIRRRNGEFVETEEHKEERLLRQAKFAKRKLESNASRYEEETEQEALERDAEMGIDRETTDLVDMLESTEEGSFTFFKFKDEKLFDSESNDQANKNILQLDFAMFEPSLEAYDTTLLLDMNDLKEQVQSALNEHPIVLDKPLVPSFSKNAKGYVMFKSQPNVTPEVDGIYLRNDGSNHRVISTPQVSTKPAVNDDLDEILALDQKPIPNKTALPKPGSIKKPVKKQPEEEMDDEAWLDDILG